MQDNDVIEHRLPHVGVVIPARDEAASIQEVINTLIALNKDNQVRIEHIVVCDNGSVDATATLACDAGALVVSESIPGYGRACLRAMDELPDVDIILFIDADGAFYAHQAVKLIHAVCDGADLAIGSRSMGQVAAGALTWPQRYGTGLACLLISLLWSVKVTDLGPYRAISRHALQQLEMSDETYGWTVEMQVKAIQAGFTVVELPVDTRKRQGRSKISGTWRGCVGAAMGIFSKIAQLWWQKQRRRDVVHCPPK